MSTKIRKQVYLDEKQAQLLKDTAKALGISESAFARRALDNYLKDETQQGRRWKREDAYEERMSRYNKRSSNKG